MNGEAQSYRALGAISGTSMDGIDVAVIDTDGTRILRRLGGRTLPYPEALSFRLKDFIENPVRAETELMVDEESQVTEAFRQAVATTLQSLNMQPSELNLIGMHGQTIWHRPERGFTRQLGDGATIGEAFGVDTVDRFRHADVQAGGEGAPFAPLYHRAMAAAQDRPVVFLNLGGVGNVSYVSDDLVLAFDTGPASALIDDFVMRRFGVPYDEAGRIAERGIANAAVIENFMKLPFFSAPPPKSLDRQDFHALMSEVETLDAPEDAVSTLTACTVAATVSAAAHLPERPTKWVVTGGGRRNNTIMNGLRDGLGVPVEPVENIGFDGDLVEAECFAFLAVRSALGLPLSLPTTTGVPEPMPGGRLSKVAS